MKGRNHFPIRLQSLQGGTTIPWPSFLPSPPLPGSGSTGKGTHLARIPNQTRSSRNGTHCSYRHVGPCAHEGVGHGVDELPAHPEVTQLDLPSGVDEDVGRLHIWGQSRRVRRGPGLPASPGGPRGLLWVSPRCMIWCFSRRYARPRSTCRGAGQGVGGEGCGGGSPLGRSSGQTRAATVCGTAWGLAFRRGTVTSPLVGAMPRSPALTPPPSAEADTAGGAGPAEGETRREAPPAGLRASGWAPCLGGRPPSVCVVCHGPRCWAVPTTP